MGGQKRRRKGGEFGRKNLQAKEGRRSWVNKNDYSQQFVDSNE